MGSLNVTPSGGASGPIAPIVKAVTPTTGLTLAFDNASYDQTYDLTPATPLAALTITFPSEATSTIGQVVSIFSTQTITLLTLNGATTIRNLPVALMAGAKIFARKVRANVWDVWLG